MRRFTSPDDGRRVHVPMRVPDPNDPRGDWSDYPQRVAELVDALVALGCGEKPSDVLRGMAEVRWLCVQCGKDVEDKRCCYALPTCFACLPPPPPIPVVPFLPR